jgi:hypothetical protein
MYIELTGTGGASTNLVVPANKKLYFIFNNSTGAVTVKVSGQTGVSVPTGKKMVLVSNGTDIVNGLNYIADFASNSATITHLSATSASITNLTLTSLVISNLSIASANITTLTGSTQTLSGNLTLSGGTANGVLFLDGSKVATSGSALTFDGTNGLGFGTGGTGSTTAVLTLKGSNATNNGAAITGTRNGSGSWFIGDASTALGGGTLGFIYYNYTLNDPWIWYDGGASAERMRLTSTGLGIGTSSPVAKLSVQDAAVPKFALQVGSAERAFLSYTESDFTTRLDSDGPLVFAANNAEVGRFDVLGNLGIGTSSPGAKVESAGTSNGATLELLRLNNIGSGANTQAQINFIAATNSYATITGGFGAAAPQMTFNLPSSSLGNYVWQINNTERMRLNSSGNLGIGTASPSGKLTVSNAGAEGLEFLPSGGIGGGPYFNAYNRSTSLFIPHTSYASAHTWYVGTGGATRAIDLDSSGNLGIGTSSPQAKLVISNAGANGFEFDPTTGIAQTYNRSGAAYTGYKIYGLDLEFRAGASPATAMTIDSNRNIVAGASAALATTATNGFLYVPTCAGTPTGTPTAITGMAPIVVDTTNNKLYFYSTGVWRDAGP